jgi:hypothetical protein
MVPDSVARNRQRELTHEQKLLREDKRECVDTLTDAVHGQDHSISDEGTPMKTRSFPIGRRSAALSRVMRQGRQWTQTLRTPTVFELEHLRGDDKTIDGMIRSSLLRKVRRGPLRETFGAKLDAAFMTAMISGPRYGSTIELQRKADAPNVAHEGTTRGQSGYSTNRTGKCAHTRSKAIRNSR